MNIGSTVYYQVKEGIAESFGDLTWVPLAKETTPRIRIMVDDNVKFSIINVMVLILTPAREALFKYRHLLW